MFNVLPAHDPRWGQMAGGYRMTFDPQPSLQALRRNPRSEEAWRELWENLHHQGDVGDASYAAAVSLIALRRDGLRFDWNFPALISTIEIRRGKGGNPLLPDWLEADYRGAWAALLPLVLEDIASLPLKEAFELRVLLSAVALAKGFETLGAFLTTADDSEISSYFDGVWPE